MTVKPPTPRPCESCPYRRDVPSGIWAATEYEKLREYDAPLMAQPAGMFQCHQADLDSPVVRVCGGWLGTHRDDELLSLRLAVARGELAVEDLPAVLDYQTDVPLWGSGAEAAEHGMAEIDYPGPEAARLIDKISRVRTDLRPAEGNSQ